MDRCDSSERRVLNAGGALWYLVISAAFQAVCKEFDSPHPLQSFAVIAHLVEQSVPTVIVKQIRIRVETEVKEEIYAPKALMAMQRICNPQNLVRFRIGAP